MTYQSASPDDGKIRKTFEELTDKQLETAATCFETWRHTPFAERGAVVARAAANMHARVDEVGRPVTLEVAVPKEAPPHERRVALVPSVAANLITLGAKLPVQSSL